MQNQIFTPEITGDGSFTFFSNEFKETFHSRHGAHEEALLKFVNPSQIKHKSLQSNFRLLDICYGLGYNSAVALATIWAVNPHCYVECIGLELDPIVPQTAIAHNLLQNYPTPIPEIAANLAKNYQAETGQLQAKLLIGDARTTIKQVEKLNFLADVIFLDPFSPPKCPQLWTVEFLQLVTYRLKSDGIIVTYSCSAAVRTALMRAGLEIGSTTPVGRRSPGTVASFNSKNLPPLSRQEQEHLQTRAAIPYSDPALCDSVAMIVNRRQIQQKVSDLEPTADWKKRWLV